ncbi:MAG TPA: hypothetical protein VNZ55_05475 [Thermomicrobiales bacterium]|nr:hypothetical protein [Thermomicrobiales bacterium]
MTEHEASTAGITTFQWHPHYRGRSVEAVERELASEIGNDQRAYEVALSGADVSEHDALASVMELEKRWSDYSFGWAEMEPDALARRIVAFEQERERRQELISYDQYRDEVDAVPVSGGGWRASMDDEQRRRVANIGAAIIMAAVVLIVIIVLIVVL